MQPHIPFRDAEWSEGYEQDSVYKSSDTGNPWKDAIRGEIPKDEVWDAYRDNLVWALNNVQTLVENVDGKVAITSDHGNAIGEWGLWAHPRYVPAPVLRRVPWVEIDAEDTSEYTPTVEPKNTTVQSDEIDQRLRDLGYK